VAAFDAFGLCRVFAGRYRYADGAVYEGDYRHGVKHGRGRELFANGDVHHEGVWEHGGPAGENGEGHR